VRTPASNVDIAPTILTILGLPGAEEMDGRALTEALREGPDPEQIVGETRIYTTGTPANESVLQVTTVGKQRYIDKSWRVRKSNNK